MMLTELHRVPDAALPLEACKEHLRLGTGFIDDGGQDRLIATYLRAAIAAVEARTGKALLAREFRLRMADWRDARGEVFPVAPVLTVASVSLLDRSGEASPVDPGRWRLDPDLHRPRLCPTGWLLPHPMSGGAVEVIFTAGFGADWLSVPPDLAQAVLMLSAQYHENRHGSATGPAMPFGVMALIERWRVVRGSAGGGVR
ncbi:MAG: head-tail connector protein [Alkalilacustris sp.]